MLAPAATVTPDITNYLLVIGGLLVLLLAVAALYRHPTRPCPNCDHPVRLTHRRCQNCGYRLVFIIFR